MVTPGGVVDATVCIRHGRIAAAGMGIQSLQESIPLFLDAALHQRGFSLVRCADVIAGQAARALGLGARKGTIATGADAERDDPVLPAISDVREVLESHAARMAARQRTTVDLATMAHAIAEMETEIAR